MRIKIYANYKKKEVISEAEFNDLIKNYTKIKLMPVIFILG